MSEYAKNHVASACYLRGFADDAGQVEVFSIDPRVPARRGKPDNVGHRRNFWGQDAALRRHAERMLTEIESDAADVLLDVPVNWPPPDELSERAPMLQFLAIHLIRTPGWKQLLGQLAQRWVLEHADEGPGDLTLEAKLELARSDRWAVETLESEIPVLASMFGSMHWTLVRFSEPCLATSDQPLVALPFWPGGAEEVRPLPAAGLLHVSEYRIALDSKHLLLLTWIDRGDLEPPAHGSREIAELHNRSVRAQADRQWFSKPGAETPLGAVVLGRSEAPTPVAPILFPAYTPSIAARSRRRRGAERHVHDMIDTGVRDELRCVVVRRDAA